MTDKFYEVTGYFVYSRMRRLRIIVFQETGGRGMRDVKMKTIHISLHEFSNIFSWFDLLQLNNLIN